MERLSVSEKNCIQAIQLKLKRKAVKRLNEIKEIVNKVKKLINHFGQRVLTRFPVLKKVGHLLQMLSPSRFIGILDWYIIKKFIGTYIYAILFS